MSARLSRELAAGTNPPDSPRPAAPGDDVASPHVVSVSPNDVRPATQEPSVHRDDVLISPRVIDQTSFDSLAEALRSLIDQANASVGELREALAQTAEVQAQTCKASGHLQERLRVSARMLKAFQSQIAHVQAAVTEIENNKQGAEQAAAKFDEMLSGVEVRVRDAVEQFERRAGEASRSALQRYQQQITAHQQALADTDQRINDARDRAEALARLVESAEVNVAVLAHTSAQATEQARAKAEEAAQIARRCEQARERLADELQGAAGQIDAASERGEAIRRTLQTGCRDIESRAQQLRECLARVAKADEQREGLEQTCRRLEELLGRLGPWESRLRSKSAGDGDVPNPLSHMMDELREGLGQDAAQLAASMRQIADHIEALLQPKQRQGATRQDKDDDPPPTPQIAVNASRLPVEVEADPPLCLPGRVKGL